MAGKPDQLSLGDGFQRGERDDGQSCCHPAKITGGRGSGNDALKGPHPDSIPNSILDPIERLDAAKEHETGHKTGVDSE